MRRDDVSILHGRQNCFIIICGYRNFIFENNFEGLAQVLDSSKCEISTVFIVDRDVDYASCLLSPVTYEALLDEVFSIRLVLLMSVITGNAADFVQKI